MSNASLIFVFVLMFGVACASSWQTHQDSQNHFQISYPSQLKILPAQPEGGFLFRAEKPDASALYSIRRESGLGILQLRGSIVDQLKESWEINYPKRFPEFKKEKYEELTLKADTAYAYEFTYLGQDQKTRVRQRFIMIVRGDEAFYLSMQAKDDDFDKLRVEFDRMVKSFEIL